MYEPVSNKYIHALVKQSSHHLFWRSFCEGHKWKRGEIPWCKSQSEWKNRIFGMHFNVLECNSHLQCTDDWKILLVSIPRTMSFKPVVAGFYRLLIKNTSQKMQSITLRSATRLSVFLQGQLTQTVTSPYSAPGKTYICTFQVCQKWAKNRGNQKFVPRKKLNTLCDQEIFDRMISTTFQGFFKARYGPLPDSPDISRDESWWDRKP